MNGGDELVHGKAWVENREVRVQNPGPGGKPAVIAPCHGVEILVSGKRISQPEPISEATPIQIHFLDQQPTVAYQVHISQGGLEGQVAFVMRDGIKYELDNCPPAESLNIRYTTSAIPAEPNIRGLLDALAQKGIVHGIDVEACNAACQKPDGSPFIAARGQAFTPGKDGFIRFLVPMERVVDLPADVLQVDFRETVKLPDVKAGQVIAVKTPPIPGSPGKMVTGTPIPAPKPKDPRFVAGKGVQITESTPGVFSAVATTSGCPMFADDTGIISVEPIVTFRGDVDMSSGNLRSSGGINVLGHVTEGMKVECEGNAEIGGTVTGATVKAWGSVKIRGNVFKSTIVAGKDSTWVRTMDSLFKEVDGAVDGLLSAETQIREVIKRKETGEFTEGDAQFMAEESHIERFRKMILALAAIYKENLQLFPKPIADKVRSTRDMLSGFGTGIFEKAHAVSAALAGAKTWIGEELAKGKSDIMVPYAQSAEIEASRDIVVSGQGVFCSSLIAGRSIKVLGSPGLIRGGETKARDLVEVRTAGGYGAATTVLSVAVDGKIHAQSILANTLLSVGPVSYRTDDPLSAVKASMRDDGRLVISTSSGPIEV